MRLSAVILAGGESRRMGCDKAWLETGGRSLISRAVAMLLETGVDEIFISGRAGVDYAIFGCPILCDLQPGLGPLGGIERALSEAHCPMVLVVAVDLPNLTPEFVGKLVQHCRPAVGALPLREGRIEPLAAIYPRRCHDIVRDCLADRRLSARGFAEACLREQAVRCFDVEAADADCFLNWNSPSDIAVPFPAAAMSWRG